MTVMPGCTLIITRNLYNVVRSQTVNLRDAGKVSLFLVTETIEQDGNDFLKAST